MHEHIQQRIQSIIQNVEQLPSLPDVVSKIINMVNDPDVSFKHVADEIAKDQAITANILKLCNSAYFSKGKEISSIDRAIVILGLKEVKDIVVIATTKSVLNKVIVGYDLARGELWKHGVAVAMLAKKIATECNQKAIADIAFTGGIIHDVGKTVLALFVQSTFKEILNTVTEKSITFQEAEKVVMGFDHQQIGEQVAIKWKFPKVLQSIVRYHHEPMNAPDDHKMIVSIVHIANTLCLMAGIGIGSDGLYHELNYDAIKLLSLKDSELEKLFADIPELMMKAKDIL
ncbi:MAG TPA: HDOD domain-containing protein [Spirochaetota bacterium]|nr:HDOD domain-containing protein [Spirochaetota bacterium]MBP8986390.1 HDOD domain-containing protein [Spirochaetota bacterium]HOF14236.1 HDOD domain-containing protein [Spirochaetota bacterium]HOR92935.1 HDOD domain-containing protein [Spirochaetota bacterium]